MKLSFTGTPKHGSMLAFCASEVLHGTRIPDVAGNGCQRIGSAIALQRQAMNVAIAEHKDTKLRGGTIARRRAVRQDMYICTSDPGVQYCTLGVARRVKQLHR